MTYELSTSQLNTAILWADTFSVSVDDGSDDGQLYKMRQTAEGEG